MTSIPQAADLANNYDLTWDAWNRLVKVENGTSTVADYAYDGVFRRVTKTIDSVVRSYLHSSAWQVLEERLDSSTNPDRQVIGSPNYVDDLILRDRDTSDPPNGSLDERIYVLQAANRNVTCLVDSNGDALERFSFAAYGIASILDGSHGSRSSSNFDWQSLFAGREQDVTSLYHCRNRWQVAHLGQWASRDRDSKSATRFYCYVHNNPLRYIDPLGLREVEILASPPEFNAPDSTRHTNFGTMMKSIKSKLGKDDCIKLLEIEGHSTPEFIWLGDREPVSRPLKSDQATVMIWSNVGYIGRRMKSELPFCCDCKIYLSGCNTGLRKTKVWPQSLANDTGCFVFGVGGYCEGTVIEGDIQITEYKGSRWDLFYDFYGGESRLESNEQRASKADTWRRYRPSTHPDEKRFQEMLHEERIERGLPTIKQPDGTYVG